jgi:hypothetical protein
MKKSLNLFIVILLSITLIIPIGLTQKNTQLITSPQLEIGRIEGGLFGFAVEFNNTGATNLTNLTWRTTLTGGFILYGKEANGTILDISPNGSEIATVVPIIGLGTIEIELRADADDITPIFLTIPARVFFIIILID